MSFFSEVIKLNMDMSTVENGWWINVVPKGHYIKALMSPSELTNQLVI